MRAFGWRFRPGTIIGKIVSVQNFGGGDILDITLGTRKGVLIPFTQAAVPEVSIAGGFVRIDPIAAGRAEALEGGDHRALAVQIGAHGVGDANPADDKRRQANQGQELREALDVG